MNTMSLGNKTGDLIELKGFPIPLEYFVEEFEYCYRIQIAFPTADRDNGKPIKLFLYYSYGRPQYSKVEAIRTALVEAMTHEIDECLYLNGNRLFDPHDPEKLHV
jgi:hypothetical protein